jgi:SAM-dependent methyltransferase
MLKLAVQATAFGYNNLLPGSGWRWVGLAASVIPLLRDAAGGPLMFLHASARGRLLDVGCGSGGFLAAMRDLGWEVLGVEPDPEAARIAGERYNLRVFNGTLAQAGLPAGSVDVVTMNHVIEHVHDPIALLGQCRRVLREGGKLVMVTPNAESFGHKLYRQSWLLLDPPRHLNLFSLRTIRTCAEKANLRIEILRTISRSSRGVWLGSAKISRRPVHAWDCTHDAVEEFESWVFLAFQEVLRFLWRGAGEELLAVASKT